MVIADSSVWIDALWGTINAQTVCLSSLIVRKQAGLTSLILCEVLQGVRNEKQFRGFQRDLFQLPVFETISKELAVASARNFRLLRNRGVTVRKPIDCLIATFCIVEGHELLHRDRDFDPFETHLGLRVLHPPAMPLN
jgi:predicted nucleic acid-binding protein